MPNLPHNPQARIGDPTRSRGAMKMLLMATVVSIALWFVPYASILTYPLRLLVTLVHEGGHALVTLLTGGWVSQIQIYADGSGVTHSLGGFGVLIASAGYLGATLFGALLIALVRAGVPGKRLLWITAVLVAATTLFFVRPWLNPFGFAWGAAIAAALIFAARRLRGETASWLAAFIGVQCALNALFDLRTLLELSHSAPAAQTDAVLMSRYLWLPPVVWAVLWIALSLLLLWAVLRPAPGRGRPGGVA